MKSFQNQPLSRRNSSLGNIASVLWEALPFLSDLLRWMRDIYLSSIFHTSTVYANWSKCIPAEARTGIIRAVTPPTPSPGASSLCHFAVDMAVLRRDKETEKNNNRPIDPHFTKLGEMGEIHFQSLEGIC